MVHLIELSYFFLNISLNVSKKTTKTIEHSVSYMIHILLTTVKLVLSGHSNIGKTKALKTGGSLMQVKSIADCSLEAFCNTFDVH